MRQSDSLAFHDLMVWHHEVEGQEPPSPFLWLVQLCHVELDHILRGEAAARAEATVSGRAVVVHGEDELDSVSEGEDDALEAPGACARSLWR